MRRNLLLRVLSFFAFVWAALAADGEEPICRIAAISNPYITALPAGEIKEASGRSRSWLKQVAPKGLNNAIEAANALKPDAMVVLGSLTWSGSDADFQEIKPYLKRIQAPVYVAPGSRDLRAVKGAFTFESLAGFGTHFADYQGDLRYSVNVKGVHLQMAGHVGRRGDTKAEADLVDWMKQDLEAAGETKAKLVFGGPPWSQPQKVQTPAEKSYWKLMRERKVAVRLPGGHSHAVYYADVIPTWTVPSSGWGPKYALALISVYSERIELAVLPAVDQPMQTLVIPNPVGAEPMPPAAEDPHRCPTYTRDLALKPELTFVQLADSQFDDGTNKRRARMYAYAPQTNRVAITETNWLKPPMVFLCGDLVNKNTPAEWKTLVDIYSKLRAPLYCLPGNHDLLHNESELDRLGDLAPIAKENWSFARAQAAAGEKPGRLALYRKFTSGFANKGRPYYTVEKAESAFICLDTSTQTIDDKQLAWLKGELERTRSARHVIVLGHHPMLAEFGHSVKNADQVLPLFKEYKVAAYLCGHRHRYVYRLREGTAHIICDCLCWGEHRSFQIYHLFPDRLVACWKAIVRQPGARPLYERVVFPEPRAGGKTKE